MNRLDPVSGQIVAPIGASTGLRILLVASWCIPALAALLALWLGFSQSTNRVDFFAQSAADLNLTVMLVDLWALGLAVLRRSTRTPLRIPVKTPLILAGTHLCFWLAALHLSSFGGFYRLEPLNEVVGAYVVSGWSAAGLLLLTLLSAGSATFEARLVRWVLISEETAAVEPQAGDEGVTEADMPAGDQHLYEAQMVLHELGFEPGDVDGKMSEATEEALAQFQVSCGLEPGGSLTVLTLVELRNRWVEVKQRPE